MTLERARLSAKFYLNRVSSQVAELLERQYSGNHDGPLLWLRLLNGVLDTAEKNLERSQTLGISPLDSGKLINQASELAYFAYCHIDFISGAELESLPFPVVKPLERWFIDLALENTVVFRALHDARYELQSVPRLYFDRIRDKSKSLEDCIAAIKWPFFRVTVPARALGLLPHFSIVAHEVGHAIFPKLALDLSACQESETNLLNRLSARLGVSAAAIPAQALATLQDVHTSWIQELASDAVAFFLTGPAIHFASCDFFQLLSSSYGASKEHPPNDLRRELTHKALCKGDKSFASVFHAFSEQQLTADFNGILIKKIPDPDAFNTDLAAELADSLLAAVITELVQYFRETAEEIYDQIESYFDKNHPKLKYTPEALERDLAAHGKALIRAIPPIEYGPKLEEMVASGFVSIINVGWVIYLTQLSDLRVRADQDAELPQKAEKLHRLLLKAVELSEARRLWESTK